MNARPIDTEALRRLADAAAPGPWHYIPGDYDLASAGIDITAEGDSLTWDDHSGEVFTHPDAEFIASARTAVPALLDLLAAAEHRATRAVVIYRERARQAEAERDEWRQTALDERAAALDALEQIKVRDARAADIWDEGWAQGMAYVVGMERGTDDDDLDHATTNPYRASETA